MRSPWSWAVIALLTACGASTQARIEGAYQETSSQAYVDWMFDREYYAREGELSETEMLRMLDRGLQKWPESWELNALRASSLVRQGRRDEAARAHEAASAIYYREPYCGEPLGTEASSQALAASLGIVGGIIAEINESTTDDIVIAYPSEPADETWSPSYWRDAYICSDVLSASQIEQLAHAARAEEATQAH